MAFTVNIGFAQMTATAGAIHTWTEEHEIAQFDAAKFLSTITGALLIANALGDTAA